MSTSTMTIRNLPDDLKTRLRLEAAAHGHSMEEEVRAILRRALTVKPSAKVPLGQRIHARFADIGGAIPEPPARRDRPRAAKLRP